MAVNTPSTPASELQADGLHALYCPFCAGLAQVEQLSESDKIRPLWWLCGCADADCLGMSHTPYERRGDAIRAWNTRTPPPQEAPAPVRADELSDGEIAQKVIDLVGPLCDRGTFEASDWAIYAAHAATYWDQPERQGQLAGNTRRVASGEDEDCGPSMQELASGESRLGYRPPTRAQAASAGEPVAGHSVRLSSSITADVLNRKWVLHYLHGAGLTTFAGDCYPQSVIAILGPDVPHIVVRMAVDAHNCAIEPAAYRKVVYADLLECLRECQDKNELDEVAEHVFNWLRSIHAVIRCPAGEKS